MKVTLLQQYSDYQADRRPDSVAVTYERDALTYGRLTAKSNQLARLIREAGCKRGDRVGIVLPKSIDAIVSILAVLKADCIYVPIDTTSPIARVQLILEASQCACLLAATSTGRLLREFIDASAYPPPVIGWLDAERPTELDIAFSGADVEAMPDNALHYCNSGDDIAHILFTSGSTGVPKGVMIAHNNVGSFVEWATRYLEYSSTDRISGHPPLHFDLSTLDIFGTFAAGAQLHLVPPRLNLLPHKLAEFIRKSELTQWFSVPSLLNYMARFDVVQQNDFPSLQRLMWCGESFPTPALIYWMKRLPHVSFTNLYGPTEATIASSYYRIPVCPSSEQESIPIGTACGGEELLILNENKQPSEIGEVGDLYIRGVGLSPGYWNDPKKTEAAFVQNPLSTDPDRIYRTGDLASIDGGGLVYLHGRVDSQIKSRGYRIELGEIEAAVYTNEAVRECAVVAITAGEFEGMTICCAVAPVGGVSIEPQVLREQLARRLPSYMLPSRWMCSESLPLNGNGKIDRVKIKGSFERANSVPRTTS